MVCKVSHSFKLNKESQYNIDMKIITRTRDHRETFKAKYLKSAEDFVGEGSYGNEIGIDDQYTIFYFSADVPDAIARWCLGGARYMIWHLLDDGIEFNSFSELVDKLNAAGLEWDEDSWELLTIES
jgi:hypothetical protein